MIDRRVFITVVVCVAVMLVWQTYVAPPPKKPVPASQPTKIAAPVGAPASPVAYYQQIGRAGRATERADVLLLPWAEDRDIWAYFASVSMPTEERARAVIDALAAASRPLSTAALEAVVDIRRTRLELLLKVLDVDGAVRMVSGGWLATG